jgi:hypothetical protein
MIAEITTGGGGNSPKTFDRHNREIVMQLILGCNSKTTVMFL